MRTSAPAIALARAEWTKSTSTQVLQRYGGAAVGLSVLITALLALAMNQAHAACAAPGASCAQPPLIAPDTVLTAGLLGDGTPGAGLIALMLLGAATVLAEQRHGTLGTTFLAVPRRTTVIGVKALLAFAAAAVLAAVAAVASSAVFDLLGGGAAGELAPLSATALGIAARSSLVVAAAAAGAVGLAVLVRNAVAVATLVVMWPLVLEPLLPSFLPGGGEVVAGLLPFANARTFIGFPTGGADIPWGPAASGLYFAAWMGVLLIAAAIAVERRGVR